MDVRFEFRGTGTELFKEVIVGILSAITFGIYDFWTMAHLIRWQTGNLVYRAR